jgi:exopolysaccharide biosynthesis protein
LDGGRPWPTRSSLAGGPRLISDGRVNVADRMERLASPRALPRSFIGYALSRSGRRHLVLATATAFTYQDAARFLEGYFRREYDLPCEEAMCLDGGPSSQLAYRVNGEVRPALKADVPAPTCILIHDDREQSSHSLMTADQ